jgi:hypothetical protein
MTRLRNEFAGGVEAVLRFRKIRLRRERAGGVEENVEARFRRIGREFMEIGITGSFTRAGRGGGDGGRPS